MKVLYFLAGLANAWFHVRYVFKGEFKRAPITVTVLVVTFVFMWPLWLLIDADFLFDRYLDRRFGPIQYL